MNTYFLIRALKSGDVKSLEKVYKLYYSKLFNFSRRFHSSTMDSDDFVQQTFLKVWENRNQLKEDVTLDQQIFVICKNLILNHLKRESRIISELKEDYLSPEPQDESLFTSISLKLDRLHRIMERLPSKRKNIFILHKIDNLSYNEISEALGISKKTVANHIYLAYNFIKEELQK